MADGGWEPVLPVLFGMLSSYISPWCVEYTTHGVFETSYRRLIAGSASGLATLVISAIPAQEDPYHLPGEVDRRIEDEAVWSMESASALQRAWGAVLENVEIS